MVPDDQRIAREQAFHDTRFEHETRARADKYYEVDASRARFRAWLEPIGPGDRVLEYGCGTGSAAFDLARAGAEVTGIDISPVAIERAEQEARTAGLGSASFRVMNAEALELADGSVDVVCGSGILHHLDLSRALPEIRRVLRPSGWAVFSEPLGSNPVINLYRRLTPRMRTPDEHPLLEQDLNLMRRCFDRVEVEHFNLLALAGVPFRRLPHGERLVVTLHRMDRWLFRHLPLARRWAWVVVIRLGI